ncbi:MAG: hypothetical protein GSR78_02170 [Desulfurococcales archaeon]|nr:hypothetical protein [Desulfurococcales archaeon]
MAYDRYASLPLVTAIVVVVLALSIVLSGLSVYASENEPEDGEEPENSGEGEIAESLGEFAWNAGLVLILGFVAFKYTLPYQVKHGINLPIRFKHVLDIHIASSLMLAAAALLHGFMLLEYATLLEYAIGGVIMLMVVTGILLRWSKNRKVKTYARLLHTQRLLALVLLILVAVHTSLKD